MVSLPLLFILYKCITLGLGATHTELIATFSADNSGAVGTVTVTEGTVYVELDISGINATSLPTEACFDAGMKYHIHVSWLYESDWNDRLGSSECGAAWTGGHYDPWQGCGTATSNEWCEGKGDYGCIPTTDYDCDFATNPYSCEIGDWSSKYGVLEVDDDGKTSRTDSSFFEVDTHDIAGMSVVFHCTDEGGARALCAPFLPGEESNDETPSQDPDNVVLVADFGDLGELEMKSDGSIAIEWDINNVDATELSQDVTSYSCYSTGFEYTIWNDWDRTDITSMLDGDGCGAIIGMQYDPTRHCLPWSAQTDYCLNGNLCYQFSNSSDGYEYEYECDPHFDRFSCSPSDLSGKYGLYQMDDESFAIEDDESDSLLPSLSILTQSSYSVAIHCPYVEGQEIEILACSQLTASSANKINILIVGLFGILVGWTMY